MIKKAISNVSAADPVIIVIRFVNKDTKAWTPSIPMQT